MCPLSLDDIIASHGGHATVIDLPSAVPSSLFAQIECANADLLALGAEGTAANPYVRTIHLILARSAAFAPAAYPLPENDFAIVFPLGLFARMRILARLLLRFREHPNVAIANPANDNIPNNFGWLPPGLAPIFGGHDEFDDAKIWDGLSTLDQNCQLDGLDNTVAQIVRFIHHFSFWHEYIHIVFGHFEFVDWVRQSGAAQRNGLSDAELLRGLEIQADAGASEIVIDTMFREFGQSSVAADGGRQMAIQFASDTAMQSFAMAMFFGSFDTHIKYVGAYHQLPYPHPIIRREIFFGAAARYFAAISLASRGPEGRLAEVWEACEVDGLQRCLYAFTHLAFEAWDGVYGKMPADAIHSSLTALNYGTGTNFSLKIVNGRGVRRLKATDSIDDEEAILQRVRELQAQWGFLPPNSIAEAIALGPVEQLFPLMVRAALDGADTGPY